MIHWFLFPAVAFMAVLVVVWLQYKGMAVFRAGEAWADRPGRDKSYGCGEDIKNSRVQPDYRDFFPFAFFFTIMHVAALMAATVPAGSAGAGLCAVIYLLGAGIGLFILFRR